MSCRETRHRWTGERGLCWERRGGVRVHSPHDLSDVTRQAAARTDAARERVAAT
jgi:hypothetical protein